MLSRGSIAVFSFLLAMVIVRVCGEDQGRSTAANRATPVPAIETTSTNRSFERSFTLKPTTIAPLGAKGSAEVKSGSISLHLSALGQGSFVVRAIRQSDGGAERLGEIGIVDATLSPSVQATDNKKEASANPEMVSVETETTMTFPPSFSGRDIARVQVLARGGNVVLDSEVK